jgi:hypothetical protein
VSYIASLIASVTKVIRTTQRALDLAYSSRGKLNVLWMNGNSITNFNETATTIANLIGLNEDGITSSQTDLVIALKEWLESERSGQWLLVVDGVNNPTTEYLRYLQSYLPKRRGIIIFTSCTAQIINAVGSPDQSIELPPMTYPEAVKLFKKISGLKKVDKMQFTELLQTLDHLPLAISQAASYIQTRHMTLGMYLELIRGASDQVQNSVLDVATAIPNETDFVPTSIMTTWNLALAQIKKDDERAIALLRFLSLLGPNIPIVVLRSHKMAAIDLQDNVALHDALGLLASYRLVIPSHSQHFAESTYRVHRLVALKMRVTMGTKKADFIELVLEAVESLFPEPDQSRANINECDGMRQHADAVMAHSANYPRLEALRSKLQEKIKLYRFYAYGETGEV